MKASTSLSIVIYGNVPSSKNTGLIVNVRTKRARWNAVKGTKFGDVIKASEVGQFRSKQALVPGTLTTKYKKMTEMQWISFREQFHRRLTGQDKPYKISFKFIRDSNRKFDYINAAQLVQDLMVHYGWVNDDNADELLPAFEPYEVDKKNAGVVITIV